MELIFSEIYPESKSDSNITEKNLMLFVEKNLICRKNPISQFKDNIKSCQIKGSLKRLC